MNNSNVYEFKGNIETALKNGEFQYLISFEGVNNSTFKILEKFQNKKYFEDDNIKQTLIKFRSPFRIGELHINILELKNIYNKKEINVNLLKENIINICKKYKNNIIGFPITGSLIPFKMDIIKVLKENVCGTKIVIIL